MVTALDKKISAFPEATKPLAGTEVFPLNQGGVTKRCPISELTPPDASASTAGKVMIDPAGSIMVTDAGIRGALGVVYVTGSRNIITTDHFHTLVCTAPATLTLPRSNTMWNGFCFVILAQGGDVVVTPNAADSVAGGLAGASYTLIKGASMYLSSDGALNGSWSPIAVGKQFDVYNMPLATPTMVLTPNNGTDPTLACSRASTAYGAKKSGDFIKVLNDTPKFEYFGGSLVLSSEVQSTNVFTYSSTFSDVSWAKTSVTVPASAVPAPDGTFTATQLTDSVDGVNTVHTLVKNHTTTGLHTTQLYAKAGTKTYVKLHAMSAQDGLIFWIRVNLLTGAVTASGGTGDYSVTNAGDGWWGVAITYTCTGTTSVYATLSTGVTEAYIGDGTGTIHLWCAQAEQLPYATSPIPTTSAQVTRPASTVSLTDMSWFSQDKGTLYVEFYQPGLGGSADNSPFILGNSTDSVRIRVKDSTDDKVYLTLRIANSDTDVAITSGAATPRTRYRAAFSYQAGTLKACVDGGAVGTIAQSIPTISAAQVGSGKLLKAAFYPVYMTDAELQTLTGA